MKEKIVKSYVFLGNLPIYLDDSGDPGTVKPEGCKFVINTRLKYELGVCSMQFIKQNHPSMYNLDNSNFNPEIEMDVSSLIRLKTLFKMFLKGDNPTGEKKFIQVTSTKIQKSLEYQKGAFVSVKSDFNGPRITFIMDDKKQEVFEIVGTYQFHCFYELIENCVEQLQQAYIKYDIQKHHSQEPSKHVFGGPPPVEGPLPHNNKPFVYNGPGLGEAIPCVVPVDAPAPITNEVLQPKPVIQPTTVPPAPVTEQVIPQAPNFNLN